MSESAPAQPAPSTPRPLGRRIALRTAAVARWLHIYASMFAMATVLFFSATGLTLNHPDWLHEPERHVTAEGQISTEWLNLPEPADAPPDADPESRHVARLEVVEHLRSTHNIRGALAEFRVDEQECTVVFKGPGYSADAFIDRATGRYQLSQVSHGFVAVINDLHKGRDTGRAWSLAIDISAVFLVFISLTGLVLLFYLKRRRIPGLLAAAAGTVVLIAVAVLLVP